MEPKRSYRQQLYCFYQWEFYIVYFFIFRLFNAFSSDLDFVTSMKISFVLFFVYWIELAFSDFKGYGDQVYMFFFVLVLANVGIYNRLYYEIANFNNIIDQSRIQQDGTHLVKNLLPLHVCYHFIRKFLNRLIDCQLATG